MRKNKNVLSVILVFVILVFLFFCFIVFNGYILIQAQSKKIECLEQKKIPVETYYLRFKCVEILKVAK